MAGVISGRVLGWVGETTRSTSHASEIASASMGYRSNRIRAVEGVEILPPALPFSTRRRVWNAVLDVAALPLVAVGPRRRVDVGDGIVDLYYVFRRWSWRSERALEIALGIRAVAGYSATDVLEVGNVLPLAGILGHTVVDKYEAGSAVLNVDIVDYAPGRLYKLVVSLSTLEHVGWDEEPRDPAKAGVALDTVGRLGESLLITIPVGYHREFEREFLDGPFDSVVLFVKTSRIARWERRPLSDLMAVHYGRPFALGNGVLIGRRASPSDDAGAGA
jgi:hypothetical protein